VQYRRCFMKDEAIFFGMYSQTALWLVFGIAANSRTASFPLVGDLEKAGQRQYKPLLFKLLRARRFTIDAVGPDIPETCRPG